MDWIHSTQRIKSRVEHTCDWCRQQIEKGSSYHHKAGKNEGDFFSLHLHLECDSASGEFYSRNKQDCEWPDEAMPRGGIKSEFDIQQQTPNNQK